MARGWESKAVADQIEDRESAEEIKGSAFSAQARERNDRLKGLRLSKARTLAMLERATHPAHRQMLERTLRALELEEEALEHERE